MLDSYRIGCCQATARSPRGPATSRGNTTVPPGPRTGWQSGDLPPSEERFSRDAGLGERRKGRALEGEVISRADIVDRVWGYNAVPTLRTVDNFIVRPRRIFEDDPQNPRFIQTVRGTGYRLTP